MYPELRTHASVEGYFITSHGDVWSAQKKKWLKHSRDASNYRMVSLKIRGKKKMITIHKFVALCWIGELPFPKARVLHRNDNKEDNCCLNLYYGTVKQNLGDLVRIKGSLRSVGRSIKLLSEEDLKVLAACMKNGMSDNMASKEFGITRRAAWSFRQKLDC